MPSKLRIIVQAGPHARSMCPVSAMLPAGWEGDAQLTDASSGTRVPCQVVKAGHGKRVCWMVDGLKAGARQVLTLAPAKEPAIEAVRIVEDRGNQRVDVSIRGKLFTSYHFGGQWVRPFLYPVMGPGDTRVTRSYPMREDVPGEERDHPHHKSIWVAYGECGSVDNWSEEPGHGYQMHRRFLDVTSGPVFGRIAVRNDWTNSKRKKQFEETREMVFYSLPGGERLMDLTVTFRMTEGPVTFHDTKEGGLVSVRVATSMDVRNGGRIENGYGGINEGETWGKNAPWCDYSGCVDGKHVGIAIMDHPDNPRYPTGWHVRDYGLMTANCFAWKYYRPDRKQKGDMVFPKGSTTGWTYRLHIHKGDAKRGRVKERFIDYIAPPAVTVEG